MHVLFTGTEIWFTGKKIALTSLVMAKNFESYFNSSVEQSLLWGGMVFVNIRMKACSLVYWEQQG